MRRLPPEARLVYALLFHTGGWRSSKGRRRGRGGHIYLPPKIQVYIAERREPEDTPKHDQHGGGGILHDHGLRSRAHGRQGESGEPEGHVKQLPHCGRIRVLPETLAPPVLRVGEVQLDAGLSLHMNAAGSAPAFGVVAVAITFAAVVVALDGPGQPG